MEGVTLHPLKHITVPKGDIYHAMKFTDEGYCGFGEAYFSQIEQGQAKGWKRHNRMTLNLIVPIGAVKVVQRKVGLKKSFYLQNSTTNA